MDVYEVVERNTGLQVADARGPDHNGDYAVLTTSGATLIVYEDGVVAESAVDFPALLVEAGMRPADDYSDFWERVRENDTRTFDADGKAEVTDDFRG